MGIRFLAILLALLLTACSTGIGPGHAELENKLKISLPSAWTLTRFKVVAEEDAGTKTQPDVRTRFSATLVLGRDLYKLQEHLLGRPVIVRTKAAGDMTFELNGIAQSTRMGEVWDVGFNFEAAENIELPGEPLSSYNDYVIAGSAEESALRDEVAKQAEAERKAQEEAEKAQVDAERIAQEKLKSLNQATGALFPPGARLVSRWNDSRRKISGSSTLVIESHDPLTRTFSGAFEYDNGRPDAVSGSYDGQTVSILRNDRKCRCDLIATGLVPRLKGTYSGPILGGCGQGGTIELGLQ